MHSRSRRAAAAAAHLILLAAACGDSSSTAPTGPVVVASVRVTPNQQSLFVGQSVELDAEPLASDGRPLADRAVQWTSSDEALATVSGTGFVEAKGEGPVTITATSEGKKGYAQITVSRIPIASVTANVTQLSLELGDTYALVASPKDAAGNPLTDRVCSWVSTDVMAAPLTPTGLQTATVTAHRTATVTLTARCEGKTADVAVTITPLKVARIVASIEAIALEIGVMNADGTNEVNLTADASVSIDNRMPTWSPDSRQIAFARDEDAGFNYSGPYQIFVIDARDGSGKRRLVQLLGSNIWPSWSPDGRRIAFTRSDVTYGTDVMVANVDGTGLVRIAVPDFQEGPSWSPDSAMIAFASRDPELGRMEIYTVRADGSDVRRRTTSVEWGGGSGVSWMAR